MEPEFSVLVVCLNPGEKLKRTLESIVRQSFTDYEIVIKDGLSTDGSLSYVEEMRKAKEWLSGQKLHVIEQKDTGIYDAMNQAVLASKGRYLYFLNCGDVFYDENVLSEMAMLIEENPSSHGIYYGNIYENLTRQVVASNPKMDAFGCYRNVPCHQACFYERKLLLAHPFDTRYRVRADYEQFLWCFFEREFTGGVLFCHKDILIARYEGGGFSETKENRKISHQEHQEIVRKFMSHRNILKYKLILWITLAPLRTRIAQNEKTAGWYNRLKRLMYGRK